MTPFAITRSTTINAPAAEIQPLIADLHEWEHWSPWQEADPNMSQTYSGPSTGVGAHMRWSGNKKAGEGRMTVVTADPTLVEVDLQFIKPFAATNRSHFRLDEADGSTTVHWTMTGEQNLFMKVMFRLMNMEKQIGKDFDRGLAKLKARAEA